MRKYNFLLNIKLFTIAIFLLFLIGCFYSKPEYKGELVWEKTFGGTENDQGYCIIETNDGGFAVTGSTESQGNGKQNLWILRLDKNGELVWEKTFGGTENDQGIEVLQRQDNNHFIVGGWTESFDLIFADYWLLELNQEGQLIWDKTYGGDDIDKIHSLTLDKDNNLLALGSTYSKGTGGKDAWLLKLDPEGKIIWEQIFGGTQDDEFFQINSNKEAYFLIGYSYSKGAGGKDAWLVKLNYNGELQWEKFYGDRNSEFAESIILSDNDNIIFCGQKIRYCPKCSSGGFSYYWVAHLDDNLEIKWQKIFLESSNSRPHKIIETKSNHILVIGNTINSNHGKLDISLVKMK